MKLSIKALAIAFACFAMWGHDALADDGGIELLKSWQPVKFQMATLGPWVLAQHEGASASIAVADVAGRKDVIVVNVVAASKDAESWHLDLFQGSLKFKKGASYRLSFAMKGSNLDQIAVGVARNHEPWDFLSGGEPRPMSVSADWQDCSCTFTIGESDGNGRIFFSNFNSSGALFLLANVSLKEIQAP